MGYKKAIFVNPFIKIGKKVFYYFFPSAFVNAYIRTLYLQKYIRKIPFRNALDAGCGPGLFTMFLAENFPDARFTGYDLSEENIKQCRKEANQKDLRNVSFKVQDLMKLDEHKQYDFIFSIDCLEHIPENQKAITNLVNALTPGGILYLAMPCEKIHRYLFPKHLFKKYQDWASQEHIGDQYTLDELLPKLQALGLEITHSQYTFGFCGKLAWELDMLTDSIPRLKRLLLPSLFSIGALDLLFRNNSNPYGLLVIAQKT